MTSNEVVKVEIEDFFGRHEFDSIDGALAYVRSPWWEKWRSMFASAFR